MRKAYEGMVPNMQSEHDRIIRGLLIKVNKLVHSS